MTERRKSTLPLHVSRFSSRWSGVSAFWADGVKWRWTWVTDVFFSLGGSSVGDIARAMSFSSSSSRSNSATNSNSIVNYLIIQLKNKSQFVIKQVHLNDLTHFRDKFARFVFPPFVARKMVVSAEKLSLYLCQRLI